MSQAQKFWSILIGVIFLVAISESALGAIAGDIDGSKTINLQDIIVSLQTCSDILPSSYVHKKYEISGDKKVGLEEAIYSLQVAAEIRPIETIWYKDADGDKYSDGVTWISSMRPSSIYFDESELIATSGDTDDNDESIHPRVDQFWVAFDDAEPADADATLDVRVPVSTTDEVFIEYSIPGMYSADSPEGNIIFDILKIPGCGYMDTIGKPQLPVMRHHVAIPQGASINTEILRSLYRDISGYTVYPAQEAPPDVDDLTEPPFEIDTDAYQQNSFFPSEIIQLEGPVIIRGVSTVIVQIHPVQFNPAQQKLRVYSDIVVKLNFSGGTRSFRDRRLSSDSYDAILNRIVLNNKFLLAEKDARTAYDSGNSLLIITHPNFLSAANTLQTWKIQKGIYTEVRTTSQTGSTAPAIQNYIKTAYETWDPPPTYVLLIGDAEFIPTHYVTEHPHHRTRIGTDLYYSTVDGNDYFPDISIGRLSVDTLSQAIKRVNDIVDYERTPVTDSNFYNSAAICAYFQHNGGGYAERRFAQTSEDIAIFLSDSEYLGKYNVDRIYFTKSNVAPTNWSKFFFSGGPAGDSGDRIPSYLMKPGFAWNGDKVDVTNAINNGRFLVTHRDHGATSGWEDPDYRTWDVEDLANGNKLPVVWSINCQTGWFDNETDDEGTATSTSSIHFSEAWERNPNGGAVGIIASTRVSYSGHNDRLAWGWMDAIWPDFINPYAGSGTTFDEPVYEIGPILNYGKYYYASVFGESPKRKAEFEMFHLFGDPTMQIWTEEPQDLSVSHANTLSAGATSIQLTVNESDALICISKENEILVRAKSNGGISKLSWITPVLEGDNIDITVTKHNFRPYEGSANCPSMCSYTYSPSSMTFTSSGGNGSINVTTSPGCIWAVTEKPDWISINSQYVGFGSGIVNYSVFQNTTPSDRNGIIKINDKFIEIVQDGTFSQNCDSCPGYIQQEPYVGDCNNRPAGTVCVGYDDGYTWLVETGITDWRYETCNGQEVTVAIGTDGYEYRHILNTSCVSRVVSSFSIDCESCPGYIHQETYLDNCNERPAGTVCVGYDDGYKWIVETGITDWRYETCNGQEVTVAIGTDGYDYKHILNSSCVSRVVSSVSQICESCPGYIQQEPYLGDCNDKPAGTVCVAFEDGYKWIVETGITDWRYESCNGQQVRVAIGTDGYDYKHVLNTNCVSRVVSSTSQNCDSCFGYIQQEPYLGDCNNRPAGTVCIGYEDGYTWIVETGIIDWRYETCNGQEVTVAIGTDGYSYKHVLNTKCIKKE